MPCDITLSGCQDLNLRPSTSAVGRGFAVVRRSPSAQVKRHTERPRTVADQPDKGAMVVRMVVKNRRRACLYADLWSSFRLSLSVTMSRRVMPLSGSRPAGCRYALCRRVSATWCRPGSTTRHAGTAQSGSSRRPMTSSPSSFRRVNAVSPRRGKCRQARRAHRPSEACAGVGTPNESAECRRHRQNSVSCSASALPWS
jgi:hypothetical protein